jgi:ribonuclease BN (tRNA processing enzyme)
MSDKLLTITPLGTVSPYCKGDTNCPGFLINYDDYKILLDCGNGINRLLNFPEDLKNLTIIISHLHKDHYGDLLSLGYASYVYQKLGLLKEKIKVYIPYESAPTEIKEDGWAWVSGKVLSDFEFLTNFGDEHYLKFSTYSNLDKLKFDNMNVSFAKNPHSVETYSIKIETPDKSLIYSSDTGFIDNTIEDFAKEADLLICESTFLKGQFRNGNNHLYAYEAAEIARNAKVKKLLLTHFWPEISKNEYLKEAKEIFANTEVAEEGKKLVLGK